MLPTPLAVLRVANLRRALRRFLLCRGLRAVLLIGHRVFLTGGELPVCIGGVNIRLPYLGGGVHVLLPDVLRNTNTLLTKSLLRIDGCLPTLRGSSLCGGFLRGGGCRLESRLRPHRALTLLFDSSGTLVLRLLRGNPCVRHRIASSGAFLRDKILPQGREGRWRRVSLRGGLLLKRILCGAELITRRTCRPE